MVSMSRDLLIHSPKEVARHPKVSCWTMVWHSLGPSTYIFQQRLIAFRFSYLLALQLILECHCNLFNKRSCAQMTAILAECSDSKISGWSCKGHVFTTHGVCKQTLVSGFWWHRDWINFWHLTPSASLLAICGGWKGCAGVLGSLPGTWPCTRCIRLQTAWCCCWCHPWCHLCTLERGPGRGCSLEALLRQLAPLTMHFHLPQLFASSLKAMDDGHLKN